MTQKELTQEINGNTKTDSRQDFLNSEITTAFGTSTVQDTINKMAPNMINEVTVSLLTQIIDKIKEANPSADINIPSILNNILGESLKKLKEPTITIDARRFFEAKILIENKVLRKVSDDELIGMMFSAFYKENNLKPLNSISTNPLD